MRTIAIGDIHGCSKALRSLVDTIAPEPEDRLVFLGDYVDRGPDSRGVIDFLLELKEQTQVVTLLGNHEIMFRGVLRGLDSALWLQIGGQPTLASYGGRIENVPDSHVAFLEDCVSYHETEHEIFVHANYQEKLPMTEQPEQALFWDHLSDRIPEAHQSGKHVYLGHTPQPHGRIGYFGHLTCLDTGCFAGYSLSAIDVNSQEAWQVSKQGHLRQNWRVFRRAAAILRGLSGQ
ncbi:MAG: metallophosphoesterase family protein [Aureliella sp.]